MSLLALASLTSGTVWPFVVLVICVALIVVLITALKVHAFLALILAAITAGLLSQTGTLKDEPLKSHFLQAVELTTEEFGVTAGKIGVVIALASVISMCLMESGAADKVVRRFLAFFGEKRAGLAILLSGYVLSIPIFFDTFFMLLLPLARAMRLRTGKDYLLYVMAICCGGTVTHSLMVPHPGPLAMAETLKVDLGITIMVGFVVGLFPTLCSWLTVKWINRRMNVPLRETAGASLAELRSVVDKPESQLPSFGLSILPVVVPILLISLASTFIAIQSRSFEVADIADKEAFVRKVEAGGHPVLEKLKSRLAEAAVLPAVATMVSDQTLRGLVEELNRQLRGKSVYDAASFAPIALRAETRELLKVAGLQGHNLFRLNRMLIEDVFAGQIKLTSGLPPAVFAWGEFLGNRNVALLIGAVLAVGLLIRQKGHSLSKVAQLIGPPLETAGVIILITSAGGAFGLMLKNAGVGEAIKAAVAGREVNLLFLSWLVAAIIRVAQGSATVAMLTTAAMIYPIMAGGQALPYHSIYIFMAIGFGAMMFSWMNDSGFWVVGKLSGLTEKETLKSWTVVLSVNSLAGLVICLVLAKVFPGV